MENLEFISFGLPKVYGILTEFETMGYDDITYVFYYYVQTCFVSIKLVLFMSN